MANIKCIDVSTWQGIIDWKKVKSAGYEHAILRAGFGREVTQIDNQFERNYKNAKAAGIKLGVYWYSYAVDRADAIKEAEACIKVLSGKTLEMPVFFDMEESFMTSYSKTTLTNMAKTFCDKIENAGFEAGIYSNLNWLTNYLDYNELKKKYTIWLAQWASAPQLDCDIWQYTSEGKVAGIDGSVDLNIIYNEDVVKIASTTPADNTVSAQIAAVQGLLYVLYGLDAVSTKVEVNNRYDSVTEASILEVKKLRGLEVNSKIDMSFVKELCAFILESLPLVGDVNGDGEVNVKDATAIQKLIASVEES